MTSSLIGDVSSHCLGRSSGRPFVYGPSLACPQRVSQVSMGTMVCFLANASINPQTGSGNLGPGEWSEAYQIGLIPTRVKADSFQGFQNGASSESCPSASATGPMHDAQCGLVLDPACSAKQGFSLLATAAGANLQPQLRRLCSIRLSSRPTSGTAKLLLWLGGRQRSFSSISPVQVELASIPIG